MPPKGWGEFVVDKVFPMGQGSTVRLSQEIDSIPVFGATITQALDQEGALISALGSAAQQVQGSYPTPAEQQLPGAEETALKTIQDDYQAIGARVYASDAAWYTPRLVRDEPGAELVARPAYRVEISDGLSGSWVVFVSAEDGRVLDSWAQTADAAQRVICDANSMIINPSGSIPFRCGGAPAIFRESRVEGHPRPSRM
ncbi:hypothetical protein [Acaricomes phytoseiuli]|uniref:hypothetical protein n=1 Tax=Acaricomes phytoseiuli TaxID=291968 RepID=UPI0003A2E5DC|nr:hypothetical protein [Acaricomes phytoseiuli]